MSKYLARFLLSHEVLCEVPPHSGGTSRGTTQPMRYLMRYLATLFLCKYYVKPFRWSQSLSRYLSVGGVTAPFLIFKELPYRIWNFIICRIVVQNLIEIGSVWILLWIQKFYVKIIKSIGWKFAKFYRTVCLSCKLFPEKFHPVSWYKKFFIEKC